MIFRPGQPLGVGLGLAVRINNQYSHPVCMGRRTDDYMTISNTREISPVTYSGTLMRELRNSWEWEPCERRTDETDRRVADDDVTSGSHK